MRVLADIADALPLIAAVVGVTIAVILFAGGLVMLFRCWDREKP